MRLEKDTSSLTSREGEKANKKRRAGAGVKTVSLRECEGITEYKNQETITKGRNKMLNLQSVYFGQKHEDFDYKDFDVIKKIQRLARKHQRQCENACNGEGWLNGQYYYAGTIDSWIKQQKPFVLSAYVTNSETTIFEEAIDKIEAKIDYICSKHSKSGKPSASFNVEFQHDPRGATVKLYYEGDFIEL